MDYDAIAEPVVVDVVSEVPFTNTVESPVVAVEMSAAEKLKSQSTSTQKSSKNQKKKKGRTKDSGTSSEEERWLDAIESGKLEQVDDELKKIKDPKLMTARQRAMYERGTEKEPLPGTELLMSLPTGYKEKVMTAEAIQKAQLKSQKRKQMADEKREKDKKKTMERLLKKQDSKSGKNIRSKHQKAIVPMITYKNTIDGALLTFPPNVEFPLKSQIAPDPPKPTLCAMCPNIKRYNCSKTNLPLCSFRCYKQNVASLRTIIC